MKKICRCCKNQINAAPILRYENMPKAAQFFPKKEDLVSEKGVTLEIYQCSHCGLIQLLDEPVAYYRDVIRTAGISEELKAYRRQFFGDFVEKYNLRNKKIIEIGAGCGEFLSIMNMTGVHGYGLEHLRSSVEECRKKGLEVYQGFIEDANTQIEGAPYDAFFIMNFLEHIPDPGEFLTGIRNNLSDDAVGLIEVPDTDMMLEKLMFSEFISDHLMYFTKDSLKTLLELNGFEVLSCDRVWHDYVLSAVVRKKMGVQLHAFQQQLEKIKKEVHKFIDRYNQEGKRVVVWGAGHQALAILALTDIKSKVAYVVDSAPFKQNKYTPGTHIPIVSPGFLYQQEAEIAAVLIMAASYSDEVAKIVANKFKYVSIGILRDNGVEELK